MDKSPETTRPAVSFDVFAVSPQGYEIHFQLSGEKAYCHAVKLLETMSKDGFTARPSKSTSTPRAKPAGADNATDTQVCAVHNATMKRHEKDGNSWYSHKLADGAYCKGKAA